MTSLEEANVQNGDILNLMKQSKIYWQVKKQIVNSLLKGKQNYQYGIQQILKCLVSTDNEQKINGLIINCLQKSTRRIPIEYDLNPQIQIYRHKWSDMITKQFNNIATQIVKNDEYDEEDQSVNYTYDSSTLLQFLGSIKIKNSNLVRQSTIFFFPNDIIKVSKYPQLRAKYSFLLSQENIIGQQRDLDLKDRQKKARKIADGENISNEIQNYLCYGCVNGDRVNVYKRYFECFYQYNAKRVDFSLFQKVWKPILRLDCKEIMKDPTYFVFKEQLEKVYKQFICDKQISQMVKIRQLSPDCQLDKYSPIHHVLPCKNFSTYMAPFCYCSLSAEEIYEIFREFYCNYIIHLNTISSLPDSILSLCVLFEELLYTTQKKLVTKFEELSIQPIRIVFPWIFYTFIGYISIDQIFLLYDRIIGAKSMQILPLYCVSILFKCKTQILQAKSENEIIQVLVDCLHEDIWIETIRDFFKYHL